MTAGETALNQTASLAPADEVKGRRSTTARGAPVTRTELIRRCAALDSGNDRNAGLRSCSDSRATRRDHAAPDVGNRDHQCRSRTNTTTDARAHGVPGGANQRAGTWHELRDGRGR